MQMYVKYVTPRPKALASDCTLGGLLDTFSPPAFALLASTPILITGRLLRAAVTPRPPRAACSLARAAQLPLVKILLYRAPAHRRYRIVKMPGRRRGGGGGRKEKTGNRSFRPVLPDFIG